jgi:Zn-dependent protease
MRYTFGAGSYFGIPVKIHFTFPLILIAFGLEAWLRGTWYDGLRAVVLIMAVFVCVVLHEFGHSLQVKRYGIRVRDIVLLPIGGMARAERIPENPWQEIVVAISGPLVNFALASLFYAVIWLDRGTIALGESFVSDLLVINLVLGTFNLVPAFPMDGGRILRGLLAMRFPYLQATRYARSVGQVIALGFVVIGFIDSAFLMLPVIAIFIFFGAISEENLIRTRVALEGKVVGDFLVRRTAHRSDESIATVAGEAVGHDAVIPVMDASRTHIAVVTPGDLTAAVADGRGDQPVASVARSDFPVLSAHMPATQAYYFLKAERQPFAAVVDGSRFAGLVHLSHLDLP